jgi:palmitoyltransferase
MVCNKCVEKFDHHCVYINNCLGHRNHKYFMIFLLNITLYCIFSSAGRLLVYFTVDLQSKN